MEDTNGGATGAVVTAPVVVAPVEKAPTQNGSSALDPSGIGRRVEQEVNALLEAAQADADRIRAKAIAGIRMAEAKLSAMQQQMAATLAQLNELAERIEPGRPADRKSLAQRFMENGSKTTAAAPSVFDPPAPTPEPKDERPASGIPPSEEIVRILREHLT